MGSPRQTSGTEVKLEIVSTSSGAEQARQSSWPADPAAAVSDGTLLGWSADPLVITGRSVGLDG